MQKLPVFFYYLVISFIFSCFLFCKNKRAFLPCFIEQDCGSSNEGHAMMPGTLCLEAFVERDEGIAFCLLGTCLPVPSKVSAQLHSTSNRLCSRPTPSAIGTAFPSLFLSLPTKEKPMAGNNHRLKRPSRRILPANS